jgi:NAD(P)H-dependent FMN reductase
MKLAIVLGSIRQNRQTPKESTWVMNAAKQLENVNMELVDLKDYPMPLFDEPVSPRYNPERKIDSAVKPWIEKLNEFDAYVFITPEYNHSIPGALKNALDYLTWELNRKPFAVVSHGSAGGARAATDLKEILSESRAIPIPNAVTVTNMSELIDDKGELNAELKANPYGPQTALKNMLEELKWYSDALAAARSKAD